MDNFDISNSGNEKLNKPAASNKKPAKLISFEDDNMSSGGVSHSPLVLGGNSTAGAASSPMKLIAKKPAKKTVPPDRITGVKTFFTKLHAGALEFLDGQITNWLKENPDITIKLTNTATGMVTGKKAEPNIIVTIWY